jgi:hypothetical protein
VLTFNRKSVILFEVMRDMIEYKLTWKNEDTNRVSSRKFTGEDGKDHSAMDEALELAQEADGNLWPWTLERDGHEVAYGWGGEGLTRGRLFPTCG